MTRANPDYRVDPEALWLAIQPRFDRQMSPEGCWLWTGAVNRNGYARVRSSGTQISIHRLAVIVRDGVIPEGLTVDHRCHNDIRTCKGGRTCLHRRCANPDHLDVVTIAENCRRTPNRGGAGGIPFTNLVQRELPQGRESHLVLGGQCDQGHPLTEVAAIYVRPNGWRECRQCRRDRRNNEASPTRRSAA